MPIYMNYDSLKSRLRGKEIQFGDGSVRIGYDLGDIAPAIRMSHPGGANLIVISLSPGATSGWTPVLTNDGKVAVLIGLLLPAVQKVRDAASRASLIGLLRTALAPAGQIYVINAKGGVDQVV